MTCHDLRKEISVLFNLILQVFAYRKSVSYMVIIQQRALKLWNSSHRAQMFNENTSAYK